MRPRAGLPGMRRFGKIARADDYPDRLPVSLMRQVVLDTETTGLEAEAGHRIIELGCVELLNRRITDNRFHRYVNPERPVDQGALQVHGLDDRFLASQPRFADIVEEFLGFVDGAELVIHNADFDVGFINAELGRLNAGTSPHIGERCQVLDTLALARRLHPGQRNSLDALAKRYSVDNSRRELHGALLDAEILAEVYLAMTGGQVTLSLDGGHAESVAAGVFEFDPIERDGLTLVVSAATAEEVRAHQTMLARIRDRCGGPTLWERNAALDAAVAGAGPGAPAPAGGSADRASADCASADRASAGPGEQVV